MKRAIFLLFLGFFPAIFGFAQTDLQAVATISLTKTESISVKQLRTEVERMEKGTGRPLSQSERLDLLNVMINERLAVQGAEKDRVTITENEVNAQIQELRNSMAQTIGRQPTDAEFSKAILDNSGMDLTTFRDSLRRQMITQKYLMTKKDSIFKAIKLPTEEEIRSAYTLNKASFVRPETVRFSMIQVPYGADAAARTKAKALADNLAREIGTSASKFDEVVVRGQTANSGYQAGDGGYMPRTADAQMVVGQNFLNTAFSLKQGEVSKLMEGVPGTGYQIIKLTESYGMKTLELSDIVQLGTNMTVRDYIGNAMLQERQQLALAQATQELVADLRKASTIRIFENNIKW